MKVILFFAFTFPALCIRMDQATDRVAMDAIEVDLGKVESTIGPTYGDVYMCS